MDLETLSNQLNGLQQTIRESMERIKALTETLGEVYQTLENTTARLQKAEPEDIKQDPQSTPAQQSSSTTQPLVPWPDWDDTL